MSDQEELKQHFAQRVIHQAREVLEVWQQLQRSEWSGDYHAALSEATTRLRRFADRFEQTEHSELALNIEDCLGDIRDNRGRLSSSTISTLSQLIYRLARTGLRHSDPHNQSFLPPLSKPVYIALQDPQRAEHLVRQLDFFSMSAQAFNDVAAFRTAMHRRHPAAIVMDVDFNGTGEGLRLAEQVQQGLESKLPMLFSAIPKPIPQRAWLPCARAVWSSSLAPWTPAACWRRSKSSPVPRTTNRSAC
ncbi:hypothetical protein PsSCT_03050 [Pseudomonas sp. SCT]